MKISIRLVTCGRCGKPKGNPLTHVCVTRLDRRPRTVRTRLRPKLSVTTRCPKCRRSYTNPLTHVCTVKTDFRRRLAASRKKPAARKAAHRYESCRDRDCERLACVAYRDGYEEGYELGAAAAGRS
jgi:hypothetical protein